jgi:CheY-like chemotaxis protein
MADARQDSGGPLQAPESILLVDDNPTNLHVLFQTLSGRGYKLLIAKSGEQALHIARQMRPVLILLDILMPGLDGYATCLQLKADPVTREAAVIFLSALGETSDKVRGLELGAVDYITKPFQAEEVIARVDTHLTVHRLQQQLARRNQELDTANRFIRQIFGRYVTEEVVTSVLDDPGGLALGGEERTVTILISDLRGFTSLATPLSPTQVVAFLNHYLATMVDIIMAQEGTLDEIMGDGILVLFGAPRQRQDDACRAVGCAVAMQLAMAEVNAHNRREGLPEVEMGIGTPYHRFLPEPHDPLVPLEPGLVLRYTVLEEKYVGRTVFTGRLVQLSAKGGVIHSPHPVPALSNIKIWLTTRTGAELPGDLYGKVAPYPTTSETCFRVRFTSSVPHVRTFLQEVLRAHA